MGLIDCLVTHNFISESDAKRISEIKDAVTKLTASGTHEAEAEAIVKNKIVNEEYGKLHTELESLKKEIYADKYKATTAKKIALPGFKEINKKYQEEKQKRDVPLVDVENKVDKEVKVIADRKQSFKDTHGVDYEKVNKDYEDFVAKGLVGHLNLIDVALDKNGIKSDFHNRIAYNDFVKIKLEEELPKKLPPKKGKFSVDKSEFNGEINIKPIEQSVKQIEKTPKAKVASIGRNASKEDLRPIMMGVYFDAEGKKMVATDAHRLVWMEDSSIKESKLVNPKTGEKMEMSGKFPDYKAVIPEDNPIITNGVPIKDLIDQTGGVDRANKFIEGAEILSVVKIGDTHFAFDANLFNGVLTTLAENGAKTIDIELSKPTRAMVIHSKENPNIHALLMPRMVDAEGGGDFTVPYKIVFERPESLKEKQAVVQADIDNLNKDLVNRKKELSKSVADFRKAEAKNYKSSEWDMNYNKERVAEVEKQIAERQSDMDKLVNPLAEQENIQTVKENIDNGNITTEQAENLTKATNEQLQRVEPIVEDIERKAESYNEADLNELVEQADKILNNETNYKTQAKPSETQPMVSKVEEVTPKATEIKPEVKVFNKKVDDLAAKLKDKLIPKHLRDVGKQGGGLEEIIDTAASFIKEANRIGGDIKEAIDKAVKHIKDNWDEAWGKFDETSVREVLGEVVPPEAPPGTIKEEVVDGTRISKKGLKEQYEFTKKFEGRGDQEVANAAIDRLHTAAAKNNISVEQQAANEVAAMKEKKGVASEHDIMTAAFHLLNLDEQIKSANDSNAESAVIDILLSQREEALSTLRQLGNNAGRNLRLFGSVYRKTEGGRMEVYRAEIKRALGVSDIPKTEKDLDGSDLSAADKKRVRPYVRAIEEYEATVKELDKKVKEQTTDINSKEVQDYIKDQVAKKLSEQQGSKTTQQRQKASKNIRDIASRIRTTNEFDKFIKGSEGDIQQSSLIGGIDFRELAAQALDHVASLVEKGEKLSEAIKVAAGKFKVDAKILTDIFTKGSLPNKEDVIGKIRKLAEAEGAGEITNSMVGHGLINDIVNDYIHSDTPYDKVISEATKELKQHLPNTTEAQVEDAILKRGEFKLPTKQQLETDAVKKSQDTKRLANTNSNIRALEAANDIHNITEDRNLSAKEKRDQIEKRKSDFEKEADSRLKKLSDEKNKKTQDAENEKKRIADINEQIAHVKNEKSVFNKAIKSPKETSDGLKAAKDELKKAYDLAGIRPESGSKGEIKVAQDAEAAIKEINASDLDEKTKKEHIAIIEKERDTQLNKTKQGVLTNLKGNIDSHISELTEKYNTAINDSNNEYAKTINEVKTDLQNLSDRLKPNTENLKDQIDKANQDLTAIIKQNKGTEFENDLTALQEKYHSDWQKTSDELQRQQLFDKSTASLNEANRRLAGGLYTEIPTTPYDVKRDNVIASQDAAAQAAWRKLNNLKQQAQKNNESLWDKYLNVRRQFMIASFGAIEKVVGSGLSKPVLDPLLKQTWGRISGLVTGIKPTSLGRLSETFRQLKNEESARAFMLKRNNAYVDSIVAFEKARRDFGAGSKQSLSAERDMQKAELSYNASLPYLFINANSAIDIKQVMVNASTDFDTSLGKWSQSFHAERMANHTNIAGKILGETGYWLESINRSHSAIKSVSYRQALLDHYIENLQHLQDTEGSITVEARMKAWDTAALQAEEGRFAEKTNLSNLISKWRNSENAWIRRPANFLFPVAKISINIAKQGIDRALPIEVMYRTLYSDAVKGIKFNEVDGKEFSNFASKYYNGIKRGFNELPLEQKKYINTLLARGLAGVAQYAMVGFLLSSGALKYGGAYNPNDPFHRKYGEVMGADGEPLKHGEWEFYGHRAPKILNMIINHSPYSMPASIAADLHSQLNRKDKKGAQAIKAFSSVSNEVYERLPFTTAIDLLQGVIGGDEYRLQRIVSNTVPTFQNTAEFFDKDKAGEVIKRTSDSPTFLGRTLDMWKANTPFLRNTLPVKGESGYSPEDLKIPVFKNVHDKGLNLPESNHDALEVDNANSKTSNKLAEYDKETNDKFDALKKRYLKERLEFADKRGVWVEKEYDKKATFKTVDREDGSIKDRPPGTISKRMDELTDDQYKEILSAAGGRATTKAKKEIEIFIREKKKKVSK